MRTDSFNNWLERKFSNLSDKFDDLYVTPEQLDYLESDHQEKFGMYYSENNDIDIRNNPDFYPELIANELNQNSLYSLLNGNDNIIKKILDCTEIYKVYEKYKTIIIYPGINRSHCNLLFKMIIKCVYDLSMHLSFLCVEECKTNGKLDISIDKIIVPIITVEDKELFYKFCFENSVTEGTVERKPDTSFDEIYKYENIPPNILTKIKKVITREIQKYFDNIELLWNDIMVPYLSGEYKMIFGKMNTGILGYGKFKEFMLSLPSWKTINKINKRVSLTIASAKNEGKEVNA